MKSHQSSTSLDKAVIMGHSGKGIHVTSYYTRLFESSSFLRIVTARVCIFVESVLHQAVPYRHIRFPCLQEANESNNSVVVLLFFGICECVISTSPNNAVHKVVIN